jgi:O-antigen ligase
MNKQDTNFFLDRILLFLIFFFPLIIVLRSAAINVTTTLISLLILYNILKKTQTEIFKSKLIIYIIIFFSYILINSIIHFTSFDLLLKSLGNFRYLLLSLAVFFVFEKISDRQKKFFICFNIILILLIAFDIFYQFIFYKDIFGFLPGMCSDIFPIKCVRFSGVFGDELIAGSYLSQIGFLIIMLFLKNLNLNKNFFFLLKLFLFLFSISIILLTGERTALLIIVISFFFTCFFKKKISKFFFIFLFLLTLIFFSAQKIQSINSRFIKLFDGWGSVSEQATIINKITESPWSLHYQAAIELFLEKPFLGQGPRSFRIKCENTNIDKQTRENRHYYRDYRACSTHPHNYLLEFLSEHGICGGFFLIGLFLFVFISVYQKNKNNKNKNENENENENIFIFIGIGSLILAIIFPIKPSGSFFSTVNASMLFYIFGFFLYYLKKIK